MIRMLFLIGTAATILSGLRHGVSAQILDAQVFIAGHTGIKGELNLTHTGVVVHIVGQIRNLTPGKHGLTIYDKNDVNCDNTGDHFNPWVGLNIFILNSSIAMILKYNNSHI